MAEVRHFEFGPVGPTLAAICAIAGCVLGIILCTKAQKEYGASRARLLMYASVALGAVAVWQSTVVGLMGLGLSESILRLDPTRLAIAMAVAVASIGAGLFVAGVGRVAGQRVSLFRLVPAGLLIGAGMVGTHGLVLTAVRTTGRITYHRPTILVAVSVAAVATVALLTFVVSARGLRSAIAGGVGIGLAICAVHYIGEYSLQAHPPVQAAGLTIPAGWTPLFTAIPAMVIGVVVVAMMSFFTVGNATRRDLQVIFSPHESPAEIEDWMIEEVTARVTATPTAAIAAPVRAIVSANAVNASPRAGRSGSGERPTPSIVPVWRSLPAPGNSRPSYFNQRERMAASIHNGHTSDPDRSYDDVDRSLDALDLERVAAYARNASTGPIFERAPEEWGPLPRRAKPDA